SIPKEEKKADVPIATEKESVKPRHKLQQHSRVYLQPSPTHLGSEYHPPTPHDSPLHVVHSHGSDKGRLKLQELMDLINILSDRVGVLEADLTKT
ncbi:hypothetical protein Tco_1379836, partial [Tanacetum coccineum]